MRCTKVRGRASVVFLSLFAGLAVAQPAVLDRVPKDAAVVVAVKDVGGLRGKVDGMFKALNVEDRGPMEELDQLFETAGFNRAGSFAMVMMHDPEGFEPVSDDTMFMLVPVTDYAAFVKAMGGDPAEKLATLEEMFDSARCKDLGNGYAAISPNEELLGKIDGKGGNLEAHKARLGKIGGSVAETSDVLIVADLSLFSDMVVEGLGEGFDQAEMFAGMMGGDEEDIKKMMNSFRDGLQAMARDMKTGIIGLSMDDAGVAADFACQFKDGSGTAGMMAHPSTVRALTGRLPAIPYIAAGAMDMKNPLVAKLTEFGQAMQKMGGGGMDFMNAGQAALDKTDATAFVMGTSPALFQAGMMANLVTFTASKDTDGLMKAQREALLKTAEAQQEGVKFETTYKADAATVAGRKADQWTMKITVDPDSDQALQMQQMMMMFTGQQDQLSGYLVKADGGVIQTMSTDQALLTKAINAAEGKGGLGDQPEFKAVAAKLPATRSFEMFLSIKGTADMIGAFMEFAGMPMPFELKNDLPPIAMSATTEGGAMGFRLYSSMATIKGIGDAVKQMEEQMEAGDDGMGGGDRPKPRF
ncbi:MAG: hypothetical protein HRU70_02015 [Phycisphaeraceae bacterium]|nr:MAG: hypothetical protein HRU70_02015 [Phycisphaeraceae bacterium]